MILQAFKKRNFFVFSVLFCYMFVWQIKTARHGLGLACVALFLDGVGGVFGLAGLYGANTPFREKLKNSKTEKIKKSKIQNFQKKEKIAKSMQKIMIKHTFNVMQVLLIA